MKKIFILGTFLFLFTSLYTQSNKVSRIENKQVQNQPIRALLIGINREEDVKQNLTSSSVEDVKFLKNFLKNRNEKSYIKTLIDSEVSRKEILKWINKIIIQGDTSYTRFIYIGGHGCDMGFSLNNKELILWEFINKELKKCKVSKKIILIMSCGANGIAKEKNKPNKSWCYLTSSKSFETSYGNFKNSKYSSTTFIQSFLMNLNLRDINKIYKKVLKDVNFENKDQTPQLTGNKFILNF